MRRVSVAKYVNLCLVDQTKNLMEVKVDQGRLRQLIMAVLDIAIKRTKVNTKVTLTVRNQEIRGRNFLFCYVQDQGPGMSSDEVKTCFNAF